MKDFDDEDDLATDGSVPVDLDSLQARFRAVAGDVLQASDVDVAVVRRQWRVAKSGSPGHLLFACEPHEALAFFTPGAEARVVDVLIESPSSTRLFGGTASFTYRIDRDAKWIVGDGTFAGDAHGPTAFLAFALRVWDTHAAMVWLMNERAAAAGEVLGVPPDALTGSPTAVTQPFPS